MLKHKKKHTEQLHEMSDKTLFLYLAFAENELKEWTKFRTDIKKEIRERKKK